MCDRLPRSRLLAVDRQDLLELLAMQDAIADTAQDIAGLLVERKMEVHAGMAEPLMRLVCRCIDTCRQAQAIVERLKSCRRPASVVVKRVVSMKWSSNWATWKVILT
jgi:uncharacterized protein Yka (UPF0111/DUF47 family)